MAVFINAEAKKADKIQYLSTETITIWNAPSENYAIGKYISAGELVDVYNYPIDGFYFLTTEYGWVKPTTGTTTNLILITNNSFNGVSITSISQLVKVSVDIAYIRLGPSENYASTGSLAKGATFTATGKINYKGHDFYRKSTTEWVDAYDITKTNEIDEVSLNAGVTLPSTIDGVHQLSPSISVLCSQNQALRKYPSNSDDKEDNTTGSYVTDGKTYTVSYSYTDADGDLWYYKSDGTGWFCGRYKDNDISTAIAEVNEDGTTYNNTYVVTVDSLNFRVWHDGSTVNNIYGKFYQGDVVRIVENTSPYIKYTSDNNGNQVVLEKWICVYGKNQSGETVTGWICIEYNQPATTTDADGNVVYQYNDDGTIVMTSSSSYATNDALTVATPSNLYQANCLIVGYDSAGGSAVVNYLTGDDITLTNERKTIETEVTNEDGTTTKVTTTWAKTSDGYWIIVTDNNLTQYTQEMYFAKLESLQQRSDSSVLTELDEELVTYDDFVTEYENLRVKDMYGIWGSPYQFSRTADARIDEDNYKYGRLYAEKIVADIPLLIIMPGVPTFMGDEAASTRKEGIVEVLKSMATGESLIDTFLDKETRFYTIEEAYEDFFNYVNPMCRAGAFYLGINDRKINFGKLNLDLGSFDWKAIYNEGTFHELFSGMKYCIGFYVNSETQVSDTWGNSTSEPSIAATVDTWSDTAKEVNYLIGNVNANAGGTFDSVLETFGLGDEVNIGNLDEQIREIVDGSFLKNTAVGGILNSASKKVSGLIQGSKMIFPELWSDSSYGTEYSVNMKFMTPDGDNLSWFMNVWVPMCFCIALVAPRTLTSMNMYHSPFILSANYKSIFNCPMGIVTSLQFSKGAEGCWTASGLPTVVDVSMSIKDLYTTFAITSAMASAEDLGVTSGFFSNLFTNAFMNNTYLMDYIANSCGVNINEPDLDRDFKMWCSFQFENKIIDTISNVIFSAFHYVGRKVLDIFNKSFK